MLILSGKLILGTKVVKESLVHLEDKDSSYRDLLEKCFVALCRDLDIQVPLWLKKNTNEFVSYRRTFFTGEHFLEKVKFDRFEIRLES